MAGRHAAHHRAAREGEGIVTSLDLAPITFEAAARFVAEHHRHHRPPLSARFSIGAERDGELVAVVIIGRPVARALQDGYTAEVTRLCTLDDERARHAASKLYAAAWRAWRAMGGRRLVTYTLVDESGVSLVAAGWKALYQTKGGTWNCPSRPRIDKHPTGKKTLWEAAS